MTLKLVKLYKILGQSSTDMHKLKMEKLEQYKQDCLELLHTVQHRYENIDKDVDGSKVDEIDRGLYE